MCEGKRACKGKGKGEGVQGHATVRARGCIMVMVIACEVRRMCKGM